MHTLNSGSRKPAPGPVLVIKVCARLMAICPIGTIEIFARELSEEDLYDLPKLGTLNYEQFLLLLQHPRDIRELKDKILSPM